MSERLLVQGLGHIDEVGLLVLHYNAVQLAHIAHSDYGVEAGIFCKRLVHLFLPYGVWRTVGLRRVERQKDEAFFILD